MNCREQFITIRAERVSAPRERGEARMGRVMWWRCIDLSGGPRALKMSSGIFHVQREIRAYQASCERGDDRARGPREDDADGGLDEGDGRDARRSVHGVRPD